MLVRVILIIFLFCLVIVFAIFYFIYLLKAVDFP